MNTLVYQDKKIKKYRRPGSRWWLVFLLGVAASNILHAVIFHSGDSEDDEEEEE